MSPTTYSKYYYLFIICFAFLITLNLFLYTHKNGSTTSFPLLKLSSGNAIPQIGLGTSRISPNEVDRVIKTALNIGYRHLDCAYKYGNQKEIGAALNDVFREGKIKREDVFVTSKVWNDFHTYELALQNIDTILGDLGLAYLDLCLIHSPGGNADYLETWRALEKCVMDGKCKSIGVSNFNDEQVERVLRNATITPSTNEVLMHAYFQQKKLIEFSKQHDMFVIAFKSLKGTDSNGKKITLIGPFGQSIYTEPVITAIAQKHGKSNAQVVLRFLTQQYNAVVIPKSANEDRLRENFDIFSFNLTQQELNQMIALDAQF